MKPTVFVHTNPKQLLGALVGQYSLKRNSRTPDAFDVKIVDTGDFPWLAAREGQLYLRDKLKRTWLMDDLQSFTPLRFTPPEQMGYQGRAVLIDPDVFAVGDICELLNRDMGGHAVMCRPRGASGKKWATSVMLMDCARLTHWRPAEQFDSMFRFELDYIEWIALDGEAPGVVGALEPEWNDFDKLTPATKLLHNTSRWTQPWKTGLPVDFTPATKNNALFKVVALYRQAREKLLGRYGGLGSYKPHPDKAQERFFFGLLRECLEQGVVTPAQVEDEMRQNHVRHDAFAVIDKLQPLPLPQAA